MKDGGYKRLKERCEIWVGRVLYPQRRNLFLIEKSRLGEGWTLETSAAQLKTAQDLGWEGRIKIDEEGNLVCDIIKAPGTPPL